MTINNGHIFEIHIMFNLLIKEMKIKWKAR